MTPRKPATQPERLLTDVELELMTILWKLGEGSVADVIAGLPPGRDLAYTSVSTMLRILEQKGVLNARPKPRGEGRGHVYVPVLAKADYESRAVRHVVDRVFEGTPVALVKQLLDTVDLDSSELDELKRMISDMGGSKGGKNR